MFLGSREQGVGIHTCRGIYVRYFFFLKDLGQKMREL